MPIITGAGTVTVTVEVCFNQDPNDPAPPAAVWTDITQRCSNIRWSRGRQYELDKVEAGTFSATVDNLDGALTPGNTTSAFYPNVVLYRQIRVKAVLSSTTYYLFTGFVSRWPQVYTEAGQRASTAIEAVDVLGVLAQVNLTGWGNDALAAYNPTVVYPFDDGSTSTLFNATVGAVQPGVVSSSPSTLTSVVNPGQQFDATMPGFTGKTFTAFGNTPTGTSGNGSLVALAPNLIPSAGPWTVAFWFQTATPVSGFQQVMVELNSGAYSVGGARWLQITVNATGHVQVDAYNGSGSGIPAFAWTWSSPSAVDTGWHLFALSLASDNVTVKGVLDTAAVATLTALSTLAGLKASLVGGSPGSKYFQGNVANVAVFPADLCSDVTNPVQTVLYPAAKTAFVGERTDQRAQRIASATGFGSRFVATANGDSTMSAGLTAGQTAADALSDVATTEAGMLFGRGDGMLVSTPRHARYNPNPVYSFGELELPYSALAFDYDPTHLVNSATVSRPGGSSTTVTDAASVRANFTHSQSYTLQVASDVAVRAAAEWIVSRYKDPKIRVSAFTINPLGNSDLWAAALAIELNTCVLVTRRPPGVQSIGQTCFIDRLEHQVTFDSSGASWTVNYTLTPADTTSYMVWDAPYPYGNWDRNNWAY